MRLMSAGGMDRMDDASSSNTFDAPLGEVGGFRRSAVIDFEHVGRVLGRHVRQQNWNFGASFFGNMCLYNTEEE